MRVLVFLCLQEYVWFNVTECLEGKSNRNVWRYSQVNHCIHQLQCLNKWTEALYRPYGP